MQIFLDSANPKEIRSAWDTGMIDGITTNPSLATRANVSFREAIDQIFQIIDGPINLEVLSTDYDGMMIEAEKLAAMDERVHVKLPMTIDGIKACKALSSRGVKTNVTLVFSSTQAILAAKAGATFVSPFMGRLDDIGKVGTDLVAEIRQMYDNYDFTTKILAASERTVRHAVDCALIGADIITMTYKSFMNMYNHPLTDQGLDKFLNDWKESGQDSIV